MFQDYFISFCFVWKFILGNFMVICYQQQQQDELWQWHATSHVFVDHWTLPCLSWQNLNSLQNSHESSCHNKNCNVVLNIKEQSGNTHRFSQLIDSRRVLTMWSRVLQGKIRGSQLVNFMEIRGSFPHSQDPTTCPCPEPCDSSPCPPHTLSHLPLVYA